jgi:hypothetical protein
VLLHLPLPEGLPDIQGFLPLLPPGLRAFALYVYAHYLYLQQEYGASIGLVEGALVMGAGQYPIPAIYFHLVAVMDAMSLKQTDRARCHLLAARGWSKSPEGKSHRLITVWNRSESLRTDAVTFLQPSS